MWRGALQTTRCFFTSWRFPTFMLTTLLAYYALLALFAFWPAGDGALARFAADFRVWCLAADPSSGDPSRLATFVLLGEPIALGLVLLMVWWVPLREVVERPVRALPYAAAALLVVAAAVVALGEVAGGRATGLASDEFPGARIRTTVPAPDLELVDQDGQVVRLADLHGRVVVVTAVYASCGLTCPMIFAQTRRVLAQLEPARRAEIVVLAVTIDPEHDDPARLRALALAQGVSAPGFRLLTGEPARVNAVLDHFGVERRRNPETGVIDHSNLFATIDRDGQVAYRFTLGQVQERWMVAALRQLTAEKLVAEK